MSLAEKRLFLLDMDGTIYLSETLFDGTLDFLRYVRAIGGRYLFLTNNSSRGTDAYIAKMARLGIEAFPRRFSDQRGRDDPLSARPVSAGYGLLCLRNGIS